MNNKKLTIGTRFIASVGRYEAIVELRRDGWHRGIYDDDARRWLVTPSHTASAEEGQEYCENRLQNLEERPLKLDWKQVGGFRSSQDRDGVAKPGVKSA